MIQHYQCNGIGTQSINITSKFVWLQSVLLDSVRAYWCIRSSAAAIVVAGVQ